MWWFRRRRRREPPPPLLPALDRLAELVERVVALLDAGALTAADPTADASSQASREPLVHSVRSDVVPASVTAPNGKGEAPVAAGWVAFASSSGGYRLVEREGEAPARGSRVEVDGTACRVLRLGPSPLPGDRRRCAYVEREEPPSQGGNGDG